MDVQTHNLVIGDVAKFQKLLKEKGIFGNVVGNKPVLQSIPVDKVVEIEAQRDTQAQWAYNMLVKQNGFDNNIFEPISVMEADDGNYYCYDGLGRTAICQLNGLTTIEAWVSVGSPEEAAERFLSKNKENTRTVPSEPLFGAAIEAKRPEALQELAALGSIGLCVKTRHNRVYPLNSLDPQIKIAGFRKAMKFANNDIKILQMARDIIVNSYPDDTVVRVDIFVGLVIVLKTYKVLQRPGTPFDQLQKFFKIVAYDKEQGKLPFKKDGGNQHNAESESVAYGIVKNFTNSKISTEYVKQQVRHKVLLNKYNLTEVRQ